VKFSIITAVYNRVSTIEQAVKSLQSQTWTTFEHLIIDGASTDGTLSVLHSCADDRASVFSQRDDGIYDALNKGLALSTGDIVGLMHSDDFYADCHVLERVAAAFQESDVDAVYGDLDYVSKHNSDKIVRRWRAGAFDRTKLALGWMPPHPALFLRRNVIERWGGFDTAFRISADYDAILRYFSRGGIAAAYVPHVLVKMRVGGESNRTLAKIWLKTREDYVAIRRNGIGGVGTLIWKNLSKVPQFF
jgi:glycosyltransferase